MVRALENCERSCLQSYIVAIFTRPQRRVIVDPPATINCSLLHNFEEVLVEGSDAGGALERYMGGKEEEIRLRWVEGRDLTRRRFGGARRPPRTWWSKIVDDAPAAFCRTFQGFFFAGVCFSPPLVLISAK